MARRTTLVTIAYVALGSGCSYALASLLPDGDVSLHERGGEWLLAYVAVGAVASVLLGAAVRRWWALPAPLAILAVVTPGGDVLEELPLWVLVLACAPFAVVAIAFGWAAARLGEQPNVLDAIWGAGAALVLAYAVGWVAAIVAGHNPWEDPEGPDPVVFASAVGATLGGLGAVLGAAAASGAVARRSVHARSARASSAVSEPGSTR